VNFSRPLIELRQNYYRDLDLELDLWIEPDGTATELDRDEFEAELEAERLTQEWATAVDEACVNVARAVEMSLAQVGPDIEQDRDPASGIPRFILRA
jgi:predicted RNA-binding protein associated with RNAse of E/G family